MVVKVTLELMELKVYGYWMYSPVRKRTNTIFYEMVIGEYNRYHKISNNEWVTTIEGEYLPSPDTRWIKKWKIILRFGIYIYLLY